MTITVILFFSLILQILKKCIKLIKKINILLDSKIFILILQILFHIMNKIQKCECPPETPSYVDDDGMIICNSCRGWIEGQY